MFKRNDDVLKLYRWAINNEFPYFLWSNMRFKFTSKMDIGPTNGITLTRIGRIIKDSNNVPIYLFEHFLGFWFYQWNNFEMNQNELETKIQKWHSKIQQIHIKVILSKQTKWRKTIKYNILFALMVHCWDVKHRNGFPLHELYVTHFQRRPYCVHYIHFHLSQPLPSLILKCFLPSIIFCRKIQFWTWTMMLLLLN